MIELVVVMAVVGLLLSIAVPHYIGTLERGRQQVLVHNLAQLRRAIDQFRGDRGSFPDHLQDLVEHRYLRAVPLNPYTERADWELVPPPHGQAGRVYDVRAATGAPPAAPEEAATAPAADAPEARP